ncbi:hypothetical protein I5L07_21820 [Serratia marcescens]|nr:hypothetical protein [Serratia marcescens]
MNNLQANIFFNTGVEMLKNELILHGNERFKYAIFIDFNKYILRELLPDRFLKITSSHEVVIITSPQLRALALYYIKNIKNVIAVIDANKPLSDILNELLPITHNEEHSTSNIQSGSYLTSKEIFLLTSLLNGKPAYRLARDLSRSRKTIYSHKVNLSRKLKVKKLEHLIF